jgi:diacylglycerol kinase family enzyme
MEIPAITRDTPFYVVLNTRSGAGKALECRALMQEIFESEGKSHQFFLIDEPQHIAPIAASAVEAAVHNDGAVIVGGGDGTINAVAHAVLGTGRPFGVVPQGTFNYLSRTYAIPLDPAEATRALLNARIRPIQVGAVNEHIFLVSASLGLHPHLLEERESYTRQFGRRRSVALWAGLKTLTRGYRQLVLDIEHDEGREIIRTSTLFVSNNPLQLERMGLPEAEEVQRQRLAAVIIRPVDTKTLLWLALRGALGQLGEDRNVHNFSFRRLSVRVKTDREHRVRVATDGELVWMQSPLHFSIARESLMLMAPPEQQPVT